jgi:hypothetical protein
VVIPCTVFAAVFMAFTIVTASVVSYDPINFRLLAPAFVPLWALGALLVNEAIQRAGEAGAGRGSTRLLAILLLVALLQPVRQFAGDFSEWRRAGRGFAQPFWSESELLAYLRGWDDLDGPRPVFSNMRAAIAWHAGVQVRNAPARMRCSDRSGADLRRCFLASVDPAFLDAYLVDFTAHRYPYYYTPEELAGFVALEPVVRTADGVVYRVSRLPVGAPTFEAEGGGAIR